jgi:cytochrome c556
MVLSAHSVGRALLIAMLVSTGPAHADDGDVIDYRQHIMRTLKEQADALGLILAGGVPRDNALAHLQIIALTANIAANAFQPHVNGGEANPDVWSNWADFSLRMRDFAARTTELAKTAETRGVEAGLAGVTEALTCKGCHDRYRTEKK